MLNLARRGIQLRCRRVAACFCIAAPAANVALAFADEVPAGRMFSERTIRLAVLTNSKYSLRRRRRPLTSAG